MIQNPDPATCAHNKWHDVHHYGYDDPSGKLIHYCPTGFKQCSNCGEVEPLDATEAPQCFLWNQPTLDGS